MQCSTEKKNTHTQRLFNLLRLQLDSLAVDEDTLALIWLWPSPFADLSGELRHLALVDTLEENAGGLGCAGLDTLGDTELNRVGEADLQGDELLAGIGRGHGGSLGLDGGPVTNTNHTQNTDVTFRNAGDVILEECARCT